MSIDVNWERATSGPDGEALAERIRSFIHDKFQKVALPRFIRSVKVHSFDFGTVAPELEIKDFCDPFADFYEEDEDDEGSDVSEELPPEQRSQWQHPDMGHRSFREDSELHPSGLQPPIAFGEHLNSHFPRAGTPGIPGGTSTLGYHLMGLGGLSGTQTPLAAVAGGTSFANGWSESTTDPRMGSRLSRPHGAGETIPHRRPENEVDTSSPSRPSTANTHPSRPSLGHESGCSSGDPSISGGSDPAAPLHARPESEEQLDDDPSSATQHPQPPPRMRERRPEDFQVVCRVKYAGDIKLSLTAEILLDYPMPSFVGLPLKLNITGVTFDGVAVIAYIRKRAHFCFLSPEDADALLGSADGTTTTTTPGGRRRSSVDASVSLSSRRRVGSLLQEIRVESEIGRKENGKQVLKNVGKVERFVLEQVRRIFEEEFVFPSFWTFLI
ncbi:hypothetical protein VTN00DRAFT_9207 [Thermoascus crustaceus]|uniref:uncharacterized protein n=1 Tax=Thermoascus crustaceus TaxID=5088 RepID=UPI0037437221